ncbi:protein kinase receptor Ret oncogene isoform X2 [Calliopsis andreniformis]|uniref:protein kinase receptor Ret oncogene isoform X2 n=1 Tax=Calliopsis andreniformis TaxID=337506 RepID=UPI003FCED8AF
MTFLLLLLLLPLRTPVFGLYFPQSDLILRLPYLTRNFGKWSWNVKLLELRTLRNDSIEPKHANYRVTVPHGETVSIDSEEKSLLLRGRPVEDESGYATIVVSATEHASDEAILEIKIQPIPIDGKEMNCTDYVQDMCFWNASRYRIYENQPVTMIGTFGPSAYTDICPNFHVTSYKLLNGTEYFDVEHKSLVANASLDRDALGPPGGPGPRVSVEVQCVVWEKVTGIQYAPTKVLHVDILDQDDNPPMAQENNSIAINLRDFSAGDKLVDDNKLILKDADAESSNRYTVRIFGDTHDALNVTYNTLPIERPGGVPYTAIFSRIYAKTTLLPKSPYRVMLQVKDESLIPRYGEDTLNITLTFYGPEHRTTTTTVSSVSSRQQFSYPSSVNVTRLASRYSRVAKPLSEPHSSITFTIHGSSAFNVTQRGGIVYVANETLLKTEQTNLTLQIRWSGKDRAVSSRSIRIKLTSVPANSKMVDTCNRTEIGRLRSCANAETPKDCESRCGVASGSFSKGNFNGRCVWRWNKRSNQISVMSDHYSTCSPDLSHCPDNQCDELEKLDSRICPQDCTLESDVLFGHTNSGGRGIKSGLGTCACDELLRCTCNVDRYRARNDDPERSNRVEKLEDRENEVLIAHKASSGRCGLICMICVIGVSLFLLIGIAIAGSLITSRYRIAAKGGRRDSKRRANGNTNGVGGILPSDYIDRGDGLLIGLDTFTAANRHLLLPKTHPPDPKWEFPRSRLTIEQVLGEGEFGRVLRAKAIDIAGIPGPLTVAVKTLKENACASELADLLSEYQLLKEAQHPNVIRLLGACTTAGAPIYLIIEFAEFGSLRNYLRRSRHLEAENRLGGGCSFSTVAADETRATEQSPVYTVTSRDILSFAWQISKGMTYLADIKLVHRDLAARNVLLATGKVCKISDFGLTRDVYEDDAYLKRSKGRVPVKWMAPESLADHVYTSKSDVWSFGVLLWELVTLGASPYPGVDVHNLYNLLKAGYRMERPANCSQQLYKLMVSCWHQEAGMRPSFKGLTSHLEKMLEDSVEYLDLNPRTVHNQAYFASLHALDSPSSTETNTLKTDVVNYLEKPSSDTVTKCDKVNKLHTLWQEPIASFPEDSTKFYVNDQASNLQANHYESPIKYRSTSITSNSENDLATPTSERPQSYIDMDGKKCSPETEDLLIFPNLTDSNDKDDEGGN